MHICNPYTRMLGYLIGMVRVAYDIGTAHVFLPVVVPGGLAVVPGICWFKTNLPDPSIPHLEIVGDIPTLQKSVIEQHLSSIESGNGEIFLVQFSRSTRGGVDLKKLMQTSNLQ